MPSINWNNKLYEKLSYFLITFLNLYNRAVLDIKGIPVYKFY